MVEQKEIVQHYVIHAKCECGGVFKLTDMCLMCNPPKYLHICNKCGKKEDFDCIYPKIGGKKYDNTATN